MHITDLTERYIDLVLHANRFEDYLQSAPSVFAHYFSYWAKKPTQPNPILSEQEVRKQGDLIRSRLPVLEERLRSVGFQTNILSVCLFVGQGTSNGHAFCEGDICTVWIPIESYKTQEQVDVFLTHELIHGLHYCARPEFGFSSGEEKQHVGRQLLTEGVATYLTMKTNGCDEQTALWGSYLARETAEKWMQDAEDLFPKLASFVGERWNETGAEIGLFLANDPKDLFQYRAGYFVGLKVMQAFVQQNNLAPQQLVQTPRETLENFAKTFLSAQGKLV